MAKTRSWEKGYNNLNELGEGGNAKVYHVQCKDNDKEYALKDLIAGGAEKQGGIIYEEKKNYWPDACTYIIIIRM